MENFNEVLKQYTEEVWKTVEQYLPEEEGHQRTVLEAMNYSMRAGGKRLRPLFLREVYRMFGGQGREEEPFMAAIEMIHTFSLVHDDLPCMDNDDMRRGKPSNHKVYGEDIALLAGDALQSLAFEIMTSDKAISQSSAAACCKAVNTLAAYCGARGMVGGQVIDLINENKSAPIEVLREMDYKKTACLIKAACELGCISANADDKLIKSASEYGECIGIAFQIQDDILDVTSSLEVLGKPVGSDEKNHKVTYVRLNGLEQSKKDVEALSEEALKILSSFDRRNEFLEDLVRALITREK